MTDKNTQTTTPEPNSAPESKSKMTPKRILVIICLVLIVSVYITTLVLAICGMTVYDTIFAAFLIMCVFVPILAFILIWLIGRRQGKHVIGDPDQ